MRLFKVLADLPLQLPAGLQLLLNQPLEMSSVDKVIMLRQTLLLVVVVLRLVAIITSSQQPPPLWQPSQASSLWPTICSKTMVKSSLR